MRSRADFEGFRQAARGTIYNGQGRTLDRTYLYHTERWRSAASYVALTRQRESAALFVARETAGDAGQFARQMVRGEVRAASIASPTRDAVEVAGLSPAALATLKGVQMAGLTAEIPCEGERYDARQRRREELGVLPPEPEKDRERRKEGRGPGLGG